MNRSRIELGHHGIEQLLHAVFQGSKDGLRALFFGGGLPRQLQSPDQAAVLLFHLQEARHDGAHAERGCAASVNAGEHGGGEPLDDLLAEMPADERCHTLITVSFSWLQVYFLGDDALALFREQLRAHHVIERGGDDELQPLGQWHELAVQQHKGFAQRVVRSDELAFQAQLAAELKGPGFFREKRVGPGFNHAAAEIFAAHDAAQSRFFFKELPLEPGPVAAGLFKVVGRAQSRNAAADDSNFLHNLY